MIQSEDREFKATEHLESPSMKSGDESCTAQATMFERNPKFDDCVSEVKSLISMIEDSVVKEQNQEPIDERKLRLRTLRSILVSGFAMISETRLTDMEEMLRNARQDCRKRPSADAAVDWEEIRSTMKSLRNDLDETVGRVSDIVTDCESVQQELEELQSSLSEIDRSISDATS